MALTPAPRPGARSTSARRRGALPRRDHAARSLGPGGGTAGEVCLLLRAQDPLSASRRPGQVLSQAPSRPAAAPNLRVHPPKLLVIRTLAPEPHRLSAPLRAARNSPPDTHHCPTPRGLLRGLPKLPGTPHFPPPAPARNQRTPSRIFISCSVPCPSTGPSGPAPLPRSPIQAQPPDAAASSPAHRSTDPTHPFHPWAPAVCTQPLRHPLPGTPPHFTRPPPSGAGPGAQTPPAPL